MENARVLLFDTYCRVHTRIDLKWLGKQLDMTYEESERWVVRLIREAKLDAKIDSEKGHVVMGHKMTNPYQQTIDLTKDLAYRSIQVVSSLATQ